MTIATSAERVPRTIEEEIDRRIQAEIERTVRWHASNPQHIAKRLCELETEERSPSQCTRASGAGSRRWSLPEAQVLSTFVGLPIK